MSISILAFDTATEACSAALLANGHLYSRFELAPRQHNRLILPMIEALLAEANMRLADLDALAFSDGPGSFTGIRIAAGIAQGLALGLNLPVIVVSTLQTLAQSCYRQFNHPRILAALDAGMSQIYVGGYYINNHNIMEEIYSDRLVNIGDLPLSEINQDWCYAGMVWQDRSDSLLVGLDEKTATVTPNCFPTAEAIIDLARIKFLSADYHPASTIMPNYLRREDVWKKKR
ncbi:MAG: tRNA (adenosine(37)-N6)-threonylcarbamoyltransferase complex dimerization subunit type 1 TsaB [Pseudomonadota bacterium]